MTSAFIAIGLLIGISASAGYFGGYWRAKRTAEWIAGDQMAEHGANTVMLARVHGAAEHRSSAVIKDCKVTTIIRAELVQPTHSVTEMVDLMTEEPWTGRYVEGGDANDNVVRLY